MPAFKKDRPSRYTQEERRAKHLERASRHSKKAQAVRRAKKEAAKKATNGTA